jgi:hypothetical protein
MDFPKVITALTIASSLWCVSAQELGISTESDWIGLRVSENVALLMTQPRIMFPILPWYARWDEIGTVPEESVDPIKENLAWINQRYHDSCRDREKTVAQNAKCQISRWGLTDTMVGREVRDWQMRKSQVEFTNSLAKKLLGDTVSLTEGTLTQPPKIVWFRHWRPRLKIDTAAGWLRSNFELGYYRTF